MGSIVYNMRNRMEDNSIPDLQNITIGVFFDGTLNNRYNSELREAYEAEEKEEAEKKTKNEKHTWALSKKDIKAYKKYGKLASYQNDFTNVVKLQKIYKKNLESAPYIKTIYIEGIGTVEKENNEKEKDLDYGGEDFMDGTAFGRGENGIRGKIYKACVKIAESKEFKNIEMLKQITFDVFGFSRGAAAARSFAYEVLRNDSVWRNATTVAETNSGQELGKAEINSLVLNDGIFRLDECNYGIRDNFPKRGMLGSCLKNIAGISLEKINAIKIKVRYIGVFDTVASYTKSFSMSPTGGAFQKGAQQLNLNKGLDNAEYSIHLVAENEHRKNFALTPVSTDYSRNKYIYKNDKKLEIQLPGVHADIGGSYAEIENEIRELKNKYSGITELNDFRTTLISERWYRSNQITIQENKLIFGGAGNAMYVENLLTSNKLMGTRVISNKYSLIPLNIIYTLLTEKREGIFDKENYEQKFSIPENLSGINELKQKLEKSFDFTIQTCELYKKEETKKKEEEKKKEAKTKKTKNKYLIEPLEPAVLNRMQMLLGDAYNLIPANTLSADQHINDQLGSFIRENLDLDLDNKDIIYYFQQRISKFIDTEKYLHILSPGDIIAKYKLFDSDIATIKTKKEAIINDLVEQIYLSALRNKYLHWSAHYEGFIVKPSEPSKDDTPTESRVRSVYSA